MRAARRRRISDLFWDWLQGSPRPTNEEAGEAAFALVEPDRPVRDTLAHAVSIMRRDTDRLNAALEESDEEREARRERERERKAAYRERLSQMSQMSQVVPECPTRDKTGQDGTEGTKRDNCPTTGQAGQLSRKVPPTDSPTNLLTNQPTISGGEVPARAGFRPPEIEEVREYVKAKGYHFDPERFHAFYASKGWMVGKNRMKDWRQACVTFEKGWKDSHAAGATGRAGFIAPTEEEVEAYGNW